MGSARDIRVALEAQGKIAKQTRPDNRSSALRALNAHSAQNWLLTFGHGFGDHVQFSGALSELRRMFPGKKIEVAVCDGNESLISHVADRCHSLNSIPSASRFDLVHVVGWERLKHPVKHAPAIRASQLFLDLGLPIEGKTFAYDCPVSDDQKQRAAKWLLSQKVERFDKRFRAVLIHYRGKSLKQSKDLQHADLSDVMQWARSQGFQPIVIDRDGDNPWLQAGAAIAFPDEPIPFLAGVASLCHACIGIDSGPGHLFGAVSDRAIVCWRSHHPANYYAPMGNVLHLIPENHESFIHHKDSLPYFERHYRSATYREPGPAIVEAIEQGREPQQLAKRSIDSITLNVPQGLGDIIWVYRKFSRYFKRINFRVIVQSGSPIELRSFEWIKLLPKVGTIEPVVVTKEDYSSRIESRATVWEVIKQWKTTGIPQDYSCNTWLDAGKPLDSLCIGAVDWNFRFKGIEPYPTTDHIALAVSGSTGKTGATWTIDQWKTFVDLMYSRFQLSNPLLLLGADFDREAVDELASKLKASGYDVSTMIGQSPGKVIGAIQAAEYFVGYQSGLNVVADALDKPQTIVYFDWLRPMARSWVKPSNHARFHFGCFSDGPEAIVNWMPRPSPARDIPRVLSSGVASAQSLGGWQHAVQFVVPAGIGDISWIYSKVMHLQNFIGRQVILSVANDAYRRAEQFVRMLPNVHWGGYVDDRTSWQVISQSLPPDWTDVMGWGFPVKDYPQNLAANIHLEFGRKLKDWWPRLPIEYHYKLAIPANDREVARRIWSTLPARWVCVYVSGHNGWDLWTPADWIEFLSIVFRQRALRNFGIVFVGDSCDAEQTRSVIDAMRAQDVPVAECFAKPLGVALSLIRAADYYFGYPSGLSILANVLHTPGMMLLPLPLENLAEAYADPVCLASHRYRCLVDPRPSEAAQWFNRRGVKFCSSDFENGRANEARK